MKIINETNRFMILLLFLTLPVFIYAQGSIPTDRAMQAGVRSSSIPNFDYGNFYKSNFHSRGFQWALYSLKCPLAWEITKGQDGTFGQEIFIVSREYLDSSKVEHPDMATNFTLISNQYSANTQNIRKRTVGDSPALYNSEYLRDGHGLLTLSCAIAGENNGNNAPMVGTAPKCFGFYTDRRFLWYDSIDVDGKRDNRITPVDVTYQSTGYGHYYDTLAHNGIVSFLSAGNAIHTNVPVFDPVTNMTTAYLYPMASHGTHHNSFFDARYPNDVSKSIRPITVSGMMDGDLYDQWCNPWTTGYYVGPTYKGAERFSTANYPAHPNLNICFTFSRGNEKFSNDIAKRNEAFVDLTVPAFDVLSADQNMSTSTTGRLYISGSGTSQGSAMAAGVGALMRSVSKYLLAPIDNNKNSPNYTLPLHKQDVHKSAYDILTFTADKVPDGGIMPDFINGIPVATKFAVKNPIYNRYEFGADYNYDYVTQENDRLKRSWAIRMGFGKINAYRAVAHSIRNKGEYEYMLHESGNYSMESMFKYSDASGDTRGYQVDGKRVLHFGSKVKEGNDIPISRGPTTGDDGILNVLEWGGTSFSGETHNNQGVTRIKVIRTPNPTGFYIYSPPRLTVPDNCILAIDGILSSGANPSYIIATEPGSKILIEGFIYMTELFGNLKIGDLIMGWNSVMHFTRNSDVYGKITINPTGSIQLSDNGTVTFYPGAGIHSTSYKIIYFSDNSIATFKSATSIIAANKLNVINNAQIIIDDSATVNFDCELALNDNTELILKPGAVLHLKKLNAQATSKITMHGGSMLFLDCDNSHIAGKIIATASSISNPIHILSKLAENCYDPTTPEFLNSHSSCYANLKYAQTGSNLGANDIHNVNLSRYRSAIGELETMHETSIVSINPNPTSADANVTYSIGEAGILKIMLCNTLGQDVLEIHNGFQNIGTFTKPFSTSDLAKGVYFIKMLSGKETKVRKVIVN